LNQALLIGTTGESPLVQALLPLKVQNLRILSQAEARTDMTVRLLKHVPSYDDYGLNQNYDLTTDWKEFSTEFTTSGFSSKVSNARLMFWFVPFGKAGDKYYIDNVRLEKI